MRDIVEDAHVLTQLPSVDAFFEKSRAFQEAHSVSSCPTKSKSYRGAVPRRRPPPSPVKRAAYPQRGDLRFTIGRLQHQLSQAHLRQAASLNAHGRIKAAKGGAGAWADAAPAVAARLRWYSSNESTGVAGVAPALLGAPTVAIGLSAGAAAAACLGASMSEGNVSRIQKSRLMSNCSEWWKSARRSL